MNKIIKITFLALLAIAPAIADANWNDPTVVLSQNRVKLNASLKVSYYNAPTGASVVVYNQSATASDAIITQAVTAGKGHATVTVPTSAGAHGYYVALATGSGSSTTLVSEPVLFVADAVGADFKMTTDKAIYSRNGSVSITFENAPACTNDKIVLYPTSYKLVTRTDAKYAAPTLLADVTAASGNVILKATTAGYYNIYYLLDGLHTTIFDYKTILVGTPATVKSDKTKFVPEENLTFTFSGLSKTGDDWIGIFAKDSSIATSTPAYKVSMKGRASGKLTVPAGTLPSGTYICAAFFNENRTPSSTSSRFIVGYDKESLQYSTDSVETYYTIQSASDNRFITGATSSAKLKNMTLGTDGTAQTAQWKLVTRPDGKVDIINRATKDYLLTTSVLSGNYNLTKSGATPDETYHGWVISKVEDDQYSIHGFEEDGVMRYLANANITSGSTPESLNLQKGTNFAWKLNVVETIVTSIKGHHAKGENVKVVNGKIVVSGNQDYTTWNASGLRVENNKELPSGVYLLKWKDGRSAKVNVR